MMGKESWGRSRGRGVETFRGIHTPSLHTLSLFSLRSNRVARKKRMRRNRGMRRKRKKRRRRKKKGMARRGGRIRERRITFRVIMDVCRIPVVPTALHPPGINFRRKNAHLNFMYRKIKRKWDN
uniref:Uncharacterized protein n=1 Tax=Cacopsylla melanoneura TaxID=428564 RepID=A0A8D8XDP1_9HEMI